MFDHVMGMEYFANQFLFKAALGVCWQSTAVLPGPVGP
jgi:hypothetical protein